MKKIRFSATIGDMQISETVEFPDKTIKYLKDKMVFMQSMDNEAQLWFEDKFQLDWEEEEE